MTTQYLFDDLTEDEGLRYKAYKDTKGFWTIGIGHNIDADPKLKPMLAKLKTVGLTDIEVHGLFNQDVTRFRADLDRLIPWWNTMDDVRQDALLNMCFNMGCNKVVHEWPNFIADLKSGLYARAARRLKGTPYHKQVGNRAMRVAWQIKFGKRNRKATDLPE